MTTDTLCTAAPDELERLRAENARLIHDIQAPDGYPWEWHCTRKDEELAKLRHALGLLTTLKPDMEIDVLDPLDMAQQLVEYVNAEIERLREALAREKLEHDIARTFHDIAIKERNYERVLAMKRDDEIERLRSRIRDALDALNDDDVDNAHLILYEDERKALGE